MLERALAVPVWLEAGGGSHGMGWVCTLFLIGAKEYLQTANSLSSPF